MTSKRKSLQRNRRRGSTSNLFQESPNLSPLPGFEKFKAEETPNQEHLQKPINFLSSKIES